MYDKRIDIKLVMTCIFDSIPWKWINLCPILGPMIIDESVILSIKSIYACKASLQAIILHYLFNHIQAVTDFTWRSFG